VSGVTLQVNQEFRMKVLRPTPRRAAWAVLASACCASSAFAWVAPLGVPVPSFGVNETAPATPGSWGAESAGFYYVDSKSGCSDSRSLGTPSAPRCSIPSSLPAGAVVEVHGTLGGNSFSWQRTAAAPIFIRGQNASTRPTITGTWDTSSSAYVILENLKFAPSSSSASPPALFLSEGTHHVAVRDSEFSGNTPNAGGGIGVGQWSYSGSATANNIVIKGVNIHDLGDVTAGGDRDAHCITVNGSVNNLWVVDGTTNKCEGDAIQIEGQHERGIAKIHHIYYARNVASNHKQSGGWIKHATDVVFSQNEVYGIARSSSSEGQCIGAQYEPQNVWFIFNKLHDCAMGVFIGSDDGSGDGTDAYIIGNLIYNVHSTDPTNVYNAGAISARSFSNIWAFNNTIWDCDGGVNSAPAGINWRIFNNLIAGRTVASGSEINLEDAANSTIDNNLMFRSGGIKIVWSGTNYTTAVFGGKCASCLSSDPLLDSPANKSFALTANSPAIDKGVTSTIYATFQSHFGVSINFDYQGAARPNGAYDIGAFEYGGVVAARPSPPSSLTVR